MTTEHVEQWEVTVTFMVEAKYRESSHLEWNDAESARATRLDNRHRVVDTPQEVREELKRRLTENFTDVHRGMAIGSFGGDSSWAICRSNRRFDDAKVTITEVKS